MERFPIEDSLIYKKYREEREHIERNKWYMSERKGFDVCFEKALFDWVINKKTYLSYTSAK